eukprot:scaffold35022_cov33-Tisochrysis_lutea.AAC.2
MASAHSARWNAALPCSFRAPAAAMRACAARSKRPLAPPTSPRAKSPIPSSRSSCARSSHPSAPSGSASCAIRRASPAQPHTFAQARPREYEYLFHPGGLESRR